MTETDGAEGTSPKRRNFHGRRQGRKLRAGRAALIETLLPQLTVALPADGGALDPLSLFPRPAREVWVEIGFGAGEHLAWQAGHHPDVGIIGCEPYINGMSTLLAAVAGEGLDMVRLWADDARPLLDRLPDGSISRIFLLFADPWPKARHSSRRFIQDATVADLARLLRDDGELRIATDDAPLLDWSLERVRRNPAFTWTAQGPGDWRERPDDWPPTRYEQKALHGRPYYLRFRRHARN
ncbi:MULTISPECIES: tRNA (guanine(46)-N(7))-methyltransferase TrmB [Inquilinus]|uniref:tRNA (guanine-N(7)-)-methyltransferase n=1 Tax=Inquilinus ginsengisoli TaxID=363840 RepID=A0ABU1JYN5_9PROT|nr:tRNA (guanine(46)-N(7))-methyltransferase TrmB [Inquilinus ginsengisoli]MDR6293726.1 tRNA (guanine-N7-)-methyltransferase [Inquilinus ginsengisoli]